jgi:hypothetical protein
MKNFFMKSDVKGRKCMKEQVNRHHRLSGIITIRNKLREQQR